MRSEITAKEQEDEIITALEKKREADKGPAPPPAAEEDVTFKSRMGKETTVGGVLKNEGQGSLLDRNTLKEQSP